METKRKACINETGIHTWDSGDRWGVIVGISRCNVCGKLSSKNDFIDPIRAGDEFLDSEGAIWRVIRIAPPDRVELFCKEQSRFISTYVRSVRNWPRRAAIAKARGEVGA